MCAAFPGALVLLSSISSRGKRGSVEGKEIMKISPCMGRGTAQCKLSSDLGTRCFSATRDRCSASLERKVLCTMCEAAWYCFYTQEWAAKAPVCVSSGFLQGFGRVLKEKAEKTVGKEHFYLCLIIPCLLQPKLQRGPQAWLNHHGSWTAFSCSDLLFLTLLPHQELTQASTHQMLNISLALKSGNTPVVKCGIPLEPCPSLIIWLQAELDGWWCLNQLSQCSQCISAPRIKHLGTARILTAQVRLHWPHNIKDSNFEGGSSFLRWSVVKFCPDISSKQDPCEIMPHGWDVLGVTNKIYWHSH